VRCPGGGQASVLLGRMAGIPGYSAQGAYALQHEQYFNPYPHLELGYEHPTEPKPAQQRRAERMEEDEESLSEAESAGHERVPVSFSRVHGLACGGMLLVALIACAPLAALFGPGLQLPWSEAHSDSAQALFRSRELADIAADNVLAVSAAAGGRRLQAAPSREEAYAVVLSGFQNIDDRIRVQYPDVHRGLCEARLSPAQKEAVLSAMRHMSDPRVQSLGQSLLQAAGPSVQSQDALMVKVAILKHLQSFFREAQALREEILPASIRQQPDGLVDAANVDETQMLRSFRRWYSKSHPAQQQAPLAGRRLLSWPFPGSLTYKKTPFTVQGQGLTMSSMGNATVEYMAGQASAFFHQIGNYFSFLGLNQVVDNILGGRDWEDFKTCAKMHFQKLDPSAEVSCFSTFANAAYDEVLDTNFSRIVKQKVGSSLISLPTMHPPSQPAIKPLSMQGSGAPAWWDQSVR